MIALDRGQRIVQTPGNLASNMNEEKVLMSIGKGKYYNLGQVGGRIWELAETPVSIAELASALVLEYDVGQLDCEEQVAAFVQELLKEGLVALQA